MSRSTRFAALVAATLIAAVAGSVLAARPPSAGRQPTTADEAEESPGAGAIAHAAERLSDAGIAVDEATLIDLAASYGVGGAVRIAGWAGKSDGDDVTIESIRAMRDGDGTEGSGMGWGEIARELGVHPGLGGVIGNGGGDGRGNGNSQGNGNGAGKPNASDPAP